jgi:uncharacterized membrane protein YvbJ
MTKCPRCGYQLREPDWRCPECSYEFDKQLEDNQFRSTSPQQQPTMAVAQSGGGTVTVLAPHRYPAWILLIGLSIVAALVISLIQLPHYYRAAVLVQRAESLAEQFQDKSAVGFFTNALEITPSSRRARIGLAISYFKSPDDEDHKKALEVLQGLTLKGDEWQKLKNAMPVAYQHFFTEVKK